MIKMSVCCVTYNRPHLLGELIHSYAIQSYSKQYSELLILDDGGQYGDLRGDGWQIVSFPRRFASLGEKRNACVSLSRPDFDYFVVADDDDIYLPWWLESHAKNFERGVEWSFAGSVFWSENDHIVDQWRYRDETWIMHPSHAFQKKRFWELGGYPHLAWLEDHHLFEKYRRAGIEHYDALKIGETRYQIPYLIHRRNLRDRHAHTTGMSLEFYQRAFPFKLPTATLEIGWRKDHLAEADDFYRKHNVNGS